MNDLIEIAERVAKRLDGRRETVAISESSAGGLIAAALLAIPGASRYFLGGAVVYTATAREVLLGITPDRMAGIRSASEPYATLLARETRERFGAIWSLSETGATGPSGNRYGDASGHACFAVAGPVAKVLTLETGLDDRARNMRLFAAEGLRLLERAVDEA
ncbi:CinA family protein [uncultured Enterovirga sp.]|uniref:CinA family protein n=1 Tax=uncultured Enterovirga sp. TaxID=2026352 RepID=UPI0035CAB10A